VCHERVVQLGRLVIFILFIHFARNKNSQICHSVQFMRCERALTHRATAKTTQTDVSTAPANKLVKTTESCHGISSTETRKTNKMHTAARRQLELLEVELKPCCQLAKEAAAERVLRERFLGNNPPRPECHRRLVSRLSGCRGV